jgi:hypothetical protein
MPAIGPDNNEPAEDAAPALTASKFPTIMPPFATASSQGFEQQKTPAGARVPKIRLSALLLLIVIP